ncbi:MAG: hypothetical protein SOT13_02025 [Candidatus Aphodousia sp.]|nr:hypothetical protein [Sutterella sp.]MDY2899288.1 hypothetical protein [Candidatus Aphodousia sp.]
MRIGALCPTAANGINNMTDLLLKRLCSQSAVRADIMKSVVGKSHRDGRQRRLIRLTYCALMF